MTRHTGRVLLLVVFTAGLVAGCGSGGQRSSPSHTVTFKTAGAFPTETIVGTYSVRGCVSDAHTVARNARAFYVHSTGAPGPADLYYYELRFAYAHFEADGCTSAELGKAMQRGLTAQQRTFLLHNVSSDLHRAFQAALSTV